MYGVDRLGEIFLKKIAKGANETFRFFLRPALFLVVVNNVYSLFIFFSSVFFLLLIRERYRGSDDYLYFTGKKTVIINQMQIAEVRT